MRLTIHPSSHRDLGLFHSFDTKDISLMGGMRANGYHRPGCERQRFVIIGAEEYHSAVEKDPKGKDPGVLGHIEANVRFTGEKPVIEDLVVLEITKNLRRKGYGERAVAAALAASNGELKIHDIKASALPFWRKIGAEFATQSNLKGQTAVIRREPAPDLVQDKTADIEEDQSASMGM